MADLQEHKVAGVILDINLPGQNGLKLLQSIKEHDSSMPAFMISVRADEEDLLRAFELRAEDYLTKPFSIRVLKARIERWLEVANHPPQGDSEDETERLLSLFVTKDVKIDLSNGSILKGDRSQTLTSRELIVLRFLNANRGQILSREQILNYAWGWDYEGTPRTVDNVIVNLRKKIPGDVISSHRKLGYSLCCK